MINSTHFFNAALGILIDPFNLLGCALIGYASKKSFEVFLWCILWAAPVLFLGNSSNLPEIKILGYGFSYLLVVFIDTTFIYGLVSLFRRKDTKKDNEKSDGGRGVLTKESLKGHKSGNEPDNLNNKLDEKIKDLVEPYIKPAVWLAELANSINEYSKEMKERKIEEPAYLRTEESFARIWEDTRLEALSIIWVFSDTYEVADIINHPMQIELLDCIFQEKPYLEFPQPRGEAIADLIQAIFEVYNYLLTAGSKSYCPEIDPIRLKLEGKWIYDDFLSEAELLKSQWHHFLKKLQNNEAVSFIPKTIFEIFFEDVTKKTKSIALSVKFGPDPHKVMESICKVFENKLAKEGKSKQEINIEIEKGRQTFQKILDAKDPQELFEI